MLCDFPRVFSQVAAIAVTLFAGLFEPPLSTFQDIRLATGVRLRVAQQGPKDGPVVLLLHGYSDSSFSFSRLMPFLPAHVRVIAPDQRGHGDSERPEGGYTIDAFAGDALALMDALDVRQATVVGHSMGSFVSRRIAERAPDRVTRLVLVAGAPSAQNAAMTDLKSAVDRLTDPVDPAFVRDFQISTVYRAVPDAFMTRAIGESQKVPARVWKAALAGLMAFVPLDKPIACPTLVLGGDKDAVFSRSEQEALATSIPGASVQILPGFGHALHWEDPEHFAGLISESTGRPRRRPSAAYRAPSSVGRIGPR